jgi:polysaccharide biosynthesis PFTS motif protein
MIFFKSFNKSSKIKNFKEANNGFEYLKKNNNLGFWRSLKESFLKTPPNKSKKFSKYIFGKAAYANAEIIVHQYLIDKIIKKELYNKVLKFLSNKQPFSYPLPPIWQDEIIKNSIFTNKTFSNILFWFHVIINYLRSIYIGFKLFFIFSPRNIKLNKSTKNVHFVGLNKNNLPSTSIPENNYDIVTWYILNYKNPEHLNILHDVNEKIYFNDYLNCRISYNNEPSKYLFGFKNKFKYLFWLFIAITISLKDLFLGKWHHALILGEAIKSKITSLNDNYADVYLFQFSAQSYRPMWTYFLESKKIDIVCYFYSTSEQPMTTNLPVSCKYDFYLYNWPISYCWDSFQLNMIQNNTFYNINGIITGPIWFTDNCEQVNKLKKPFIAIFDIPPHRKYFHFGISTLTDYFESNDAVHSRFLQDIVLCATELNILVVHKVKRDIGIRSVKSYTRLLRRLSINDTYSTVSPNISPIKLIDKSIAVISMPFTSTAIYGRHRNKPSIYYDPVNWIRQIDIGAHNIPIITGKEKLKLWLINVLQDADFGD